MRVVIKQRMQRRIYTRKDFASVSMLILSLSLILLGGSIQTTFRLLSIVLVMLDGACDEHCACKRPRKEEDSNYEDSVPLENNEEWVKVSPRTHKQVMQKAAEQLEEDSDEECNKSEYA